MCLMISSKLLFYIVIKYAEKRLQFEIELDKDDIYKYLFVNLFLSVYNFHSIDGLWEQNSLIQTIVHQFISKNNYWKINKVFIYQNNLN